MKSSNKVLAMMLGGALALTPVYLPSAFAQAGGGTAPEAPGSMTAPNPDAGSAGSTVPGAPGSSASGPTLPNNPMPNAGSSPTNPSMGGGTAPDNPNGSSYGSAPSSPAEPANPSGAGSSGNPSNM